MSRFTRPIFGHLIASTCCLQDFQVLPSVPVTQTVLIMKMRVFDWLSVSTCLYCDFTPSARQIPKLSNKKNCFNFHSKTKLKIENWMNNTTIDIVLRFCRVYFLVKSRENRSLTKNFEFPALLRTGLLPSKSADTSKTPNNKIKNFSRILTNRKNIVIFLKQASKAIKSLKFCIVFYMF